MRHSMGVTGIDMYALCFVRNRVFYNLVKLIENISATARKAVASPFAVNNFAFATARA